VIALLEQELNQLPAWLDLVGEDTGPGGKSNSETPGWLNAGGSASTTGTNPDDAINRARNTVDRNRNDAERAQLQRERQTEAAQLRQQNPPEKPPPTRSEQTPPKPTNSRREAGDKWRTTLTNLINGVAGAVVASRTGLTPSVQAGIPAGSSGITFEGVWEGAGTLTSFRNGSVVGQGSTVAIFTPQRELTFRIVRNGNNYVFEAPGGARAANRYVSGNRIGFVGEDSITVSQKVTFVITVDLEVNGDQMTGTFRMEGSDGSAAARTVNCRRQ
jgi:hypothetical protein